MKNKSLKIFLILVFYWNYFHRIFYSHYILQFLINISKTYFYKTTIKENEQSKRNRNEI